MTSNVKSSLGSLVGPALTFLESSCLLRTLSAIHTMPVGCMATCVLPILPWMPAAARTFLSSVIRPESVTKLKGTMSQ
jgi:hypothetical protein